MFNKNLATLKSPDRQAKCMRIQFEIKEMLPDVIAEILHSDKWLTPAMEAFARAALTEAGQA